MSNGALSENEFETLADSELHTLERALDDVEDIEVDLQSGIINIAFADGVEYVINSHRAARQIWMAAERSAWHFDYTRDKGRWISQKSGDELWSTTEAVLSRKLGRDLKLTRS